MDRIREEYEVYLYRACDKYNRINKRGNVHLQKENTNKMMEKATSINYN